MKINVHQSSGFICVLIFLSPVPDALKMLSNEQISLILWLVFHFLHLTYGSEQNKSYTGPHQPVAAMVQGIEG